MRGNEKIIGKKARVFFSNDQHIEGNFHEFPKIRLKGGDFG